MNFWFHVAQRRTQPLITHRTLAADDADECSLARQTLATDDQPVRSHRADTDPEVAPLFCSTRNSRHVHFISVDAENPSAAPQKVIMRPAVISERLLPARHKKGAAEVN